MVSVALEEVDHEFKSSTIKKKTVLISHNVTKIDLSIFE